MYYRRRRYRVHPEQVAPFTAFFEEYLLPNQLKHGARLVGRWVTEDGCEIMALWEYDSQETYERIAAAVANDPLHARAQARRKELDPLFLEQQQDFLAPAGFHHTPRHLVAAAVCVRNDRGEVLLVQTYHRADTWEMPGGQVEEGEPPHLAAAREVLEETGVICEIEGLTGVYYNETRDIVNLVFRGRAVGGELRTSPETSHVQFLPVEEALRRVVRPHFRSRLADALAGHIVPYQSFRT